MKDKIEQIIEDVLALPNHEICSWYMSNNGQSPDDMEAVDLKLLATELLRLRDALAAAEERDRHHFVTPQNAETKGDEHFCAECGKYFTHKIHFRVGEES